MRIAVAQHVSALGEAGVVASVVRAAIERDADLVICPAVPQQVAGDVSDALTRVVGERQGAYLLPSFDEGSQGSFELVSISGQYGTVGVIGVFVGDACFDPAKWELALRSGIAVAVLCPGSEGDLQAEAALEVGIALSDALCGLVIVAETGGAPVGEPGHGSSAIIVLGDVVAEAFGDTDVLVAEVELPVAQPEPRDPLPAVPPLLAARLARHAGRRPAVGYPADLSDGIASR